MCDNYPHTQTLYTQMHAHTVCYIISITHQCSHHIAGNSLGEAEVEYLCVKVQSDIISSLNQMKDASWGFQSSEHFTTAVYSK